VKRESVDLETLRVALQQLSRGGLLMIAERAIEIVPSAKLGALVGDMVRLPCTPKASAAPRPCWMRCGSFMTRACAVTARARRQIGPNDSRP
jgi:hypothetical protein